MLSFHGGPAAGADGGTGSGLLAGVSRDHVPALIILLTLPVAIWLFLVLARRTARAEFAPARRFLRGYQGSTAVHRTCAVLLLVTGFIHLGLVPGHASTAPAMARLFAINGVLFALVAIGSFMVRRWRPAAALLLVLTVIAYLSATGNGTEDVDQLGIATKLVELAALGLVLLPQRSTNPGRGRSWLRAGAAATLVSATVITGAGLWGAEIKAHNALAAAAGDEHGAIAHHGADLTGMVMQPVPTRAPTQQEQMAAAKLAAETKAGIAKYENVQVALAGGYRPSTPAGQPLVHYANRAYAHDGRLLDPTRPEELVYATTSHGMVLMGAMYMTEKPGAPGPDPAGPLVDWHRHANICFVPNGAIGGFLSPFGTCPAGTINVVTPAMLHVWTVEGAPSPYGELDPAFVRRIAGQIAPA